MPENNVMRMGGSYEGTLKGIQVSDDGAVNVAGKDGGGNSRDMRVDAAGNVRVRQEHSLGRLAEVFETSSSFLGPSENGEHGERTVFNLSSDNGYLVNEMHIKCVIDLPLGSIDGNLRVKIEHRDDDDNFHVAKVMPINSDDNTSYVNSHFHNYSDRQGWQVNKGEGFIELIRTEPLFVASGLRITIQNRSEETGSAKCLATVNIM